MSSPRVPLVAAGRVLLVPPWAWLAVSLPGRAGRACRRRPVLAVALAAALVLLALPLVAPAGPACRKAPSTGPGKVHPVCVAPARPQP
jgi:hypothetical protein